MDLGYLNRDIEPERPACGFTWVGAHGAQHTCAEPEHGYEQSHVCECNDTCAAEPEALNDFEVYADSIWFRFGAPPTFKGRYSRAQAIRLAAWLLALTGVEGDELRSVCNAVSATQEAR